MCFGSQDQAEQSERPEQQVQQYANEENTRGEFAQPSLTYDEANLQIAIQGAGLALVTGNIVGALQMAKQVYKVMDATNGAAHSLTQKGIAFVDSVPKPGSRYDAPQASAEEITPGL